MLQREGISQMVPFQHVGIRRGMLVQFLIL